MKKPLFVLYLIFPLFLSAQNKAMFNVAVINNNTKLIGRYPDKSSIYKEFGFIIENPAEIRAALKLLTVGVETENIFDMNPFIISIVQNNNEEEKWFIFPNQQLAAYNGHTYKFDISKLKSLHKMHPFEFKLDVLTFKTSKQYDTYLLQQKANRNFLFSYSPDFRYEGSFEIQFPRNRKYSSPLAICNLIEPVIEKIVTKKEYSVSYTANTKNLSHPDQFTMTIQGSKKLFEKLKIDGLKNENWQLEVEKGDFYYKIK